MRLYQQKYYGYFLLREKENELFNLEFKKVRDIAIYEEAVPILEDLSLINLESINYCLNQFFEKRNLDKLIELKEQELKDLKKKRGNL
jgi:hypothetical protein